VKLSLSFEARCVSRWKDGKEENGICTYEAGMLSVAAIMLAMAVDVVEETYRDELAVARLYPPRQ
jgi:hypothetical protein